MASVKNVLTWTSAIMLSVAIAAPINPLPIESSTVPGIDVTTAEAPSKHSNPLQKAEPVVSTASRTVNSKAFGSSAAAAALHPSAKPQEGFEGIDLLGAVGRQVENGYLGKLDGGEDPLTDQFVHDVQGKIESRQLNFLNSFLNGVGTKDGKGGLGGLAKREDFDDLSPRQLDFLEGLLGGLGGSSKRDSLEGDDFVKRETTDELSPRQLDVLTGLLDSLGGSSKRDSIELTPRQLGVLSGLLGAKRDTVNDLKPRQALPFDIVSKVATAMLSNAGSAAGNLGKGIGGTSKARRDDIPGTDLLSAGFTPGKGEEKGGHDGEENPLKSYKDEVDNALKKGEDTLHAAGKAPKQVADGLQSRQVPPITGGDGLDIVKGIVANPKAALTPLMQGVSLFGNGLGSLGNRLH